jgi:excisionase family DNA binding protein
MSRSRPNATTQHYVMRSVAEAAKETGIAEEAIRAWIEGGHLSAQQFGRTTLVNLLAVQSLGLRPPAERVAPDRGWSRYYRRIPAWLRALGAANVLAGTAGLAVFAGFGPGDLRTAWWLLLCLGNLGVGAAEWRGLPQRRRPARWPGR